MSHLIYAIGDVHGCSALLREALQAVARHAPGHSRSLVLLGDYVDRGDDVRGVLDLLISQRFGMPAACLRGNHEQMLLDCIDDPTPRRFSAWLRHGGAQTLASYGADELSHEALRLIPADHIRWMRLRPSKVEQPYHIFVHAGIAPHVALTEQDDADFLWARDAFVRARPRDFLDPRHIIHGHTPLWRGKPEAAIPELLPHRTNLDTGAYATGVLTVGVFSSDRPGGPVDLLSIV